MARGVRHAWRTNRLARKSVSWSVRVGSNFGAYETPAEAPHAEGEQRPVMAEVGDEASVHGRGDLDDLVAQLLQQERSVLDCRAGFVVGRRAGDGVDDEPDAQASVVGALDAADRRHPGRRPERLGGGHECGGVAHRTAHDAVGQDVDRQARRFGGSTMRPRVALRPTSPQAAAGMRMEPPPSLACAIGTTPAATRAADPPDDAPVE